MTARTDTTSDPVDALRQRAEQALDDSEGSDAYSGELRTVVFDLLAERTRQAEERAGSEEAFRVQGQELLHHIRECERLQGLTEAQAQQIKSLSNAICPNGSVTDMRGLVALAGAHREDSDDVDTYELRKEEFQATIRGLQGDLATARADSCRALVCHSGETVNGIHFSRRV